MKIIDVARCGRVLRHLPLQVALGRPPRPALLNRRKKLAEVVAASVASSSPRAAANAASVCATKLGSLRRPRIGTGARYGASVSINRLSAGSAAAVRRSPSLFLNVNMPENEMKKPICTAALASAWPELKQCSTPLKDPAC